MRRLLTVLALAFTFTLSGCGPNEQPRGEPPPGTDAQSNDGQSSSMGNFGGGD